MTHYDTTSASDTGNVTPAEATRSALSYVSLADIAVAPENARANEETDEDIPGLAETIQRLACWCLFSPALARRRRKSPPWRWMAVAAC